MPTISSLSPTSGVVEGGTTVTITGSGFSATTSVTFAGVVATGLAVLSDTQLTCVTPAHALGAVDVVIVTASGAVTEANAYTYHVSSAITAINPSSGSASGGVGITLTGTNLTGTTALTFDGIAATSINVVNATTVTAVTPAHAASAVNVVLINANGSATLNNGYTYFTTAVGQASNGGFIGCLNGGLADLISAIVDIGTTLSWGTTSITGATSATDGATNTTTLVNALGAGSYAAVMCSNYEIDSLGNSPCQAGNTCYADWFLPAKDQLNCLYNNRLSLGGFSAASYWSSTESSLSNAWQSDFSNGSQSTSAKAGSHNVRCVRAFTP